MRPDGHRYRVIFSADDTLIDAIQMMLAFKGYTGFERGEYLRHFKRGKEWVPALYIHRNGFSFERWYRNVIPLVKGKTAAYIDGNVMPGNIRKSRKETHNV